MRCSAIVRIKSSAPTIIASPSWINEVKLLRGCASWFWPRQAMVVLSDKTSRFHPRHVVLKPTEADEFEMPVRCEWISHRTPSDRYVGFSFAVGGGGRCCRCSRRLVARLRRAEGPGSCPVIGVDRK